MNLYEQLIFGESKKQLAHFIVDCFAPRHSYVNLYLHNFVECLSAFDTSQTFANAFQRW